MKKKNLKNLEPAWKLVTSQKEIKKIHYVLFTTQKKKLNLYF